MGSSAEDRVFCHLPGDVGCRGRETTWGEDVRSLPLPRSCLLLLWLCCSVALGAPKDYRRRTRVGLTPSSSRPVRPRRLRRSATRSAGAALRPPRFRPPTTSALCTPPV